MSRERAIALGSLIGAIAIYVVLVWALPVPAPREGLLPTLTPTRALTVLPTATLPLLESGPVLPTKTPKPPIVIDLLPMTTATPRPTVTRVIPTETPEPTATPDRPPVQKG